MCAEDWFIVTVHPSYVIQYKQIHMRTYTAHKQHANTYALTTHVYSNTYIPNVMVCAMCITQHYYDVSKLLNHGYMDQHHH